MKYVVNQMQMGRWKHQPSQAFQLESLILAQSERYWRALDMQVVRESSDSSGGRVSNT